MVVFYPFLVCCWNMLLCMQLHAFAKLLIKLCSRFIECALSGATARIAFLRITIYSRHLVFVKLVIELVWNASD